MNSLFTILSLNREIHQVTVVGFNPDQQTAEEIANQRVLDDPYIIVNLADKTTVIRDQIVTWAVRQGVDAQDANQIVTDLAIGLREMMEEIRNE